MRVAHPPAKPLLVYDGDCDFCRRWVARWQQATGDRVEYRPAATVAFPEIPATLYAQSVVLIDPDGTVFTGAAAVFRARGRYRWYQTLPGLAAASEVGYQLIARHRKAFSILTRWLWGADVGLPQYERTRALFLRLLGVVYLIAFGSLWTQLDGLIGSRGILPAARFMDQVRTAAHVGQLPTLCWLNTSDVFLHALCAIGCLAAGALILGRWRVPALIAAWGLYLSLASVAGVFLNYQWDSLLLETGGLGILFALGRARPWLLRLLLFKLMFSSGILKLTSGDPHWHNLTALTVHYETQPLPTWIGWWTHQLPVAWQKLSCAVMFGIELGLPFLIFAPRRLRLVAAGGFTVLMVLIAATGNYTFFNLLTVVLCVSLLDDSLLRRGAVPSDARPDGAARWIVRPVAVIWVLFSTLLVGNAASRQWSWPQPLRVAYSWLTPFRSLNGYGLFAVMTTVRYELELEGSADGILWHPYVFRYKPGDPARRPGFIAPHQPRLDWQFWFEALRVQPPRYTPSGWFHSFCARLLRGDPAVAALLADNPFPDQPPRELRITIYRYHFTDRATRRRDDAWWRRETLGILPALSLREQAD